MKILIFKNDEQEPFKKYDDPKQVKICADSRIVRIYNFPEGTLEAEYGLISKEVTWIQILDEQEILLALRVEDNFQ